jgi:hypothetical protein
VGALKTLEQGISLLRIIAQSEAVKEARDRVLNRIADQASRVAQSGLVPKAISAPAELVAELLAVRRSSAPADPPFPAEPVAEPSAEPQPTASCQPTAEPEPTAEPPKPRAAKAVTGKTATKKKAEPKAPSARSKGKQTAETPAKKAKAPSKKVRDKAPDLK